MLQRKMTWPLLLILLLPTLVGAQPLTGDRVGRFLQSMKALQADENYVAALHEQRRSGNRGLGFPGSMMVSEVLPAAASGEAPGDQENLARLETIVTEHGFNGPGDWASTGDRILLTLMSFGLEDSAPALLQQISDMEKGLAERPHFSDTQKARMAQMLTASRGRIEQALEVTQAEREVVKPYIEELQRALAWTR